MLHRPFAVVAEKEDARRISKTRFVERTEHLADHRVSFGNHRKVDSPHEPNRLIRKPVRPIFCSRADSRVRDGGFHQPEAVRRAMCRYDRDRIARYAT